MAPSLFRTCLFAAICLRGHDVWELYGIAPTLPGPRTCLPEAANALISLVHVWGRRNQKKGRPSVTHNRARLHTEDAGIKQTHSEPVPEVQQS
jgi:hypothetical protein